MGNLKMNTAVLRYPGDTSQAPQWIPETADTKPYVYHIFSLYVRTSDKIQIRRSKRLTTITNNKIEQCNNIL